MVQSVWIPASAGITLYKARNMQHTSNWFFILFASMYALYILVEVFLDTINVKYIEQHKDKMPELYEGLFSKEDYKKSISYTKAKTKFKLAQLAYNTVLVWALILTGSFHSIDTWLKGWIHDASIQAVAYPFALGGILFIAGIPLSVYFQFVIEEAFGFNKTQPKTFVTDQFKSLMISVILGVPLIALLFWLVRETGDFWWVYGWSALMLFQLFTAAIFPVVLAPLFFKFTPLQEGDLKDRITRIAKQVGFKMAGIFTIDGSRRSSHSNAFFAGIGKTRRIVLFDTLEKSLTTSEIVSVIAHEMGHNIKKHIQKGLVISAVFSLFGFYVLAECLQWPLFFEAFGVPDPSIHVGFMLFALFSSVFVFWTGPFFKLLSRKNEYEADEYSVEVTKDKENMIGALLKLSKDNLSNLTPHPWYSFYHYSHPTTTERASAIDRTEIV